MRYIPRPTGKFLEGLGKRLVSYAEAEFGLSRLENGKPLRDHLRQVERTRQARVDELHPKEPHPNVLYLWGWFLDLHSSRGEGGLTYSEIAAWAALTGIEPSPWEISILRRLDRTYLASRAEDNT